MALGQLRASQREAPVVWEGVPWSGTVTALLSISLAVAQRLRKLDFPVKDSEEPSIPGVDKNLFLRPRVPGEDTGKVSGPGTWGQSPVLCGLWVASGACCCYRESQQGGQRSGSHYTCPGEIPGSKG